uniref:Transposase n=1 Tax=Ditylenchus dipsaci TaxID=166011 RepID=A0A915E8D3_9BILA
MGTEFAQVMSRVYESVQASSGMISISADIATTKGLRQSFLGIAVHYWCDDCNTFKVAGLDLVEIEGRHSAYNIAKLLDESLKKAGLNNSPLRFVTDGASNMKAAIW